MVVDGKCDGTLLDQACVNKDGKCTRQMPLLELSTVGTVGAESIVRVITFPP